MAAEHRAHSLLIVDPVSTVRLALRWALSEVNGLEVAAEAATGADAIALAGSLSPDLVLLEVDLPDADGFSTAAMLRSLPSPPAVLFLTLHNGPVWLRRAREAGAAGLLEKGIGWEALLTAVRTALRERAGRSRPDRPAALEDGASGLPGPPHP
jgi:two-component system response regulator DesR